MIPEPTSSSAEITSVPMTEPSTTNDAAAAVNDTIVIGAAKPVRVFRVAQVTLEQQRPKSIGTATPLVKPKSFRVMSTVTHASPSSTVMVGEGGSALRSTTEGSDAVGSMPSKDGGNQEILVNPTTSETVASSLQALKPPVIMMPTVEQTMPLFPVSSPPESFTPSPQEETMKIEVSSTSESSSLSEPVLGFDVPPMPEAPAVTTDETSRPTTSRSFRVTGSTVATVRIPTDEPRLRPTSSLVQGLAPVSTLPEQSLSVASETMDDENEQVEEGVGFEVDTLSITSMQVPRVRYRPALTFIDDTLLDEDGVRGAFDQSSTQSAFRHEGTPNSCSGTDCSSGSTDDLMATTVWPADSSSLLPEVSLRHLQQRNWRQLRETNPLLDTTTARNGGIPVARVAAGSQWTDSESTNLLTRFVTTSATLTSQKEQQQLKEQQQQQEQQQLQYQQIAVVSKDERGLEVEDETVLEVKYDREGQSSNTTTFTLHSSPEPHQLTTAMSLPMAEQHQVDPAESLLSPASSITTTIAGSEMSSAVWPVMVAGQGALLRSTGGSMIAAHEYFHVEPASLTVSTSSSTVSSAAAIAAGAVIFKEDVCSVRGRVLPIPVPLYVIASHLFSTSTDPVLRYEPLYDDRRTVRSMPTKVHQSMPPLTTLSKIGLSILRAPKLESSLPSRKEEVKTETDTVAGDEGSVTVNSAFTVSKSLPSGLESEGSDFSLSPSITTPTMTTTNKSSRATTAVKIRLLPVHLSSINGAGNSKRTGDVRTSTALMLLDPSSKSVALNRTTSRRRSQWRKAMTTRRTAQNPMQNPSPRTDMNMTLAVVPYHRSFHVHGHCYDRTMMTVETTANGLSIVHQKQQQQQQQPGGNAVAVVTHVSTLTPEDLLFLFAARIVALLLLPSALIAWALCRRLLRRSMTSLTYWRRRRQEERLARLEDRAIVHMAGGQGLGDSRDLDEAIRLLTDAMALATTLLRSSSTTSTTTMVKALPGSSSSGSGGVASVVCGTSIFGLQHLLAKAHAAAGYLWKADEILRDTLQGYRKMSRQAHGHKLPIVEVGEEGAVGDDGDEVESIAYGEDDGLVEAGALEDLGVVLWRQAQQAHHRIIPLDQSDDRGEECATGGGELSAEGLRLLEEGYDMLMAALKIYEREMIEQLSNIDPEAVRAMYKARLEAAATAAAAVELMSLPTSYEVKDVRCGSLRSHSPTSLIHAGDSDDDDDCDQALRDLEESLFATDDPNHLAIDTSAATGGNSQLQSSKPRLTLAAASSEGTTITPSSLDSVIIFMTNLTSNYLILKGRRLHIDGWMWPECVTRSVRQCFAYYFFVTNYKPILFLRIYCTLSCISLMSCTGLIFESTGQCDDSVVIFSEARDMLDELLALDIVRESDDRVRREATIYANLIAGRLMHYLSGKGDDSHGEKNSRATEKSVNSSPVLKLLGSPIAKMARTPSDKKSSVMPPQRLQFTPGRCAAIHPYSTEDVSPVARCYGHDNDEYDYALLSSENHEKQVKKVNDRSPDTVQAVF